MGKKKGEKKKKRGEREEPLGALCIYRKRKEKKRRAVTRVRAGLPSHVFMTSSLSIGAKGKKKALVPLQKKKKKKEGGKVEIQRPIYLHHLFLKRRQGGGEKKKGRQHF